MSYSMTTMFHALKALALATGANPFEWEESPRINPHLARQFKYGRGRNFSNDLLEYCWIAYSKAFSASGPQLIGRSGDLWVTEQLHRAGMNTEDRKYLWDPHAKGNIQRLDKWSPVVNDCWILGGVHRRADFHLVSIRTLENLWNFNQGYHVVTAREILGLLHFGYSLEKGGNAPKGGGRKQPGGVLKLVCTDPAKAQAATIKAYSDFMKGKEATGADSIRSILVMRPELRDEIAGFDRSRLRHVPPKVPAQ